MPEVPAFCLNCGAIFGSGIVLENVRRATLSGNRVGPCPVCGDTGEVPDGVYSFVDGTIKLISGPERTVHQLKRLARFLNRARKQSLDKEEIQKEVEENYSWFSTGIDWLPDDPIVRNSYLVLMLTVLGFLADQGWSYLDHQELEDSDTAEEVIRKAQECQSEEDIKRLLELIENTPPSEDSTGKNNGGGN